MGLGEDNEVLCCVGRVSAAVEEEDSLTSSSRCRHVDSVDSVDGASPQRVCDCKHVRAHVHAIVSRPSTRSTTVDHSVSLEYQTYQPL